MSSDQPGQELEEPELQPFGHAVHAYILNKFPTDQAEAEAYQNAEKQVLYSMAAYAYITKNQETQNKTVDETVNFIIEHTKIINVKVQESNATLMNHSIFQTPGIAPSTVVETLATNFHCREEDLEELRTTIQNLTTEGALALGLGSDDEEGHGYISVNLFDF